jgi:putative transcriptional regulator
MDSTTKALANKMCGEVVFADCPGKVLKKWRLIFEVSQKELANRLNVSPSVISDYEGDRRKSPGIAFIRKIIAALFEIDRERGYKTVSKYRDLLDGFQTDILLDMKEYNSPVSSSKFREIIDGEDVVFNDRNVGGHTVIDSIKAILRLNSYDFYRLYGFTTERALIFTKVSTGRSPMVAVRVANLKPAVVVLNSIKAEKVDYIAAKIAKIENIHLIATEMDANDIIRSLRKYLK